MKMWIQAGAADSVLAPGGGPAFGIGVMPPDGHYWAIATGTVSVDYTGSSPSPSPTYLDVPLALETIPEAVKFADSRVHVPLHLEDNEQVFAMHGTVTLAKDTGITLRGYPKEIPHMILFKTWTVAAVEIDDVNGAGLAIGMLPFHPTHPKLVNFPDLTRFK